MQALSFFTAVDFNGKSETKLEALLEFVDDYFHLAGKKARVIPLHDHQLSKGTLSVSPKQSSTFKTALKVASYFTVILPLIMLGAKALLRRFHSFHAIDVKRELEGGLQVSAQTLAKVQTLMPKIFRRMEEPQIEWHNNTRNTNLIFSLKEAPGLVFKLAPRGYGRITRDLTAEQIGNERFANMICAKEICLIHGLSLLYIPRALKFEVEVEGKKLPIIVEERLSFNADESVQEELYHTCSGLKNTIAQITTFVGETGFSDVEWRNLPILDEAPAHIGDRRVALIDLEEMDSTTLGFFGGTRRGLALCMTTEADIDHVLAEAARRGVKPLFSTVEEVKQRRLKELSHYHDLQAFHVKKGITAHPRQPVEVPDLNSLGLNLEATDDGIKMRAVVEVVIREINAALAKTPESNSTKAKRKILLDINNKLFNYRTTGRDFKDPKGTPWLRQIVEALVKQGHVFRLDEVNDHGYFIQA